MNASAIRARGSPEPKIWATASQGRTITRHDDARKAKITAHYIHVEVYTEARNTNPMHTIDVAKTFRCVLIAHLWGTCPHGASLDGQEAVVNSTPAYSRAIQTQHYVIHLVPQCMGGHMCGGGNDDDDGEVNDDDADDDDGNDDVDEEGDDEPLVTLARHHEAPRIRVSGHGRRISSRRS